ncbi:hypothetical protein JCM3766R1_005480 [Sporobolomyces carnicolor]
MALRRPPTGISLKPSDVTDLREFIKLRNEDRDASSKSKSTATAASRDPIFDQERDQAAQRDARGTRARIMGQ